MPLLRDWVLFNHFRQKLIQLLLDRKAESLIEITRIFPAFAPCSAGDYAQLAKLTISSINKSFPILAELAEENSSRLPQRILLAQFPEGSKEKDAAQKLSALFDLHGSDKGSELGYSSLYGPLLFRAQAVRSILEIGMGTTHTDTISHMSSDKKPEVPYGLFAISARKLRYLVQILTAEFYSKRRASKLSLWTRQILKLLTNWPPKYLNP